MKRFTSLLALLLIFTLVLPGNVFALSKNETITIEEPVARPDVVEPGPEEDLPEYVRVIVEMDDSPIGVKLANQELITMQMSSEQLSDMVERAYSLQQAVLNSIATAGIGFDLQNQFAVSYNGFSGLIAREDLAGLNQVPGVRAVHLAQQYVLEEPDMGGSVRMIGALPTWDLKIKGQGTVVSVLDSGIDAFHKDFATNELEDPKLDEAFVAGTGLPGVWFNEKVPYAYNYYDKNPNPKDSSTGGQHGQHVAGTVGANGELKGVAPETQILGMKVFGNDPAYQSTWSDIYIKAIDDSLILRADAMNMSLGSPAGFDSDPAFEAALNTAYEVGVIISISAGNEHTLYAGAQNVGALPYPFFKNPDVGVVGMPSATYNSLSVASWDNAFVEMDVLKFYPAGGMDDAPPIGHHVTNEINDPKRLGADNELVYANYGVFDSDYDDLDVAGKVVLVFRGLPQGAPAGTDASFEAKTRRAMAMGAAGIIIGNNQGTIETIGMGGLDEIDFPVTMIGRDNANAMLEAMQEETQYVAFLDEKITIQNPAAILSGFSSWGPTPNLKMKPEITAPGGNITSLQNDDRYGVMSGTSMAAPHVAGGLALMQQYLSTENAIALFGELSHAERATMTKNLLMNTAIPGTEADGWLYKVRAQGAGMMDLYGAVTTTTTLVNRENGLAKVELGDFAEKSFTLPLRLTNYSDADKTYTWADNRNVPDEVSDGVHVMRDDVQQVAGFPYFLMEWSAPVNVTVEGLADTITVPAGQSVDLDVTIDFSEDIFFNTFDNQFIEGYVMLQDEDGQRTSLPFLGFAGDLDELDVIDLDRNDPNSQFGYTGLLTNDLSFYKDPAAINPLLERGVRNEQNLVVPIYSFLRNSNEIEFNITNDKDEVVRVLSSVERVRKIFRLGSNPPYRIMRDASWDGMINGQPAADGLYHLNAVVTPTREGSPTQTRTLDVFVDKTAPVVSDIAVEGTNVSFTVVDPAPGVGIGNRLHVNTTLAPEYAYIINRDTNEVVTFAVDGASEAGVEEEITVDVSSLLRDGVPNNLDIHLWDNATNESVTAIDPSHFAGDDEDSYLYIWVEQPGMWSFVDYETPTSGYVWGYSSLEGLYISVNDGEEIAAQTQFHDEIVVTSGANTVYRGPGWTFNANLSLTDGFQEVRYRAVALDGTEDSIIRRFFVDNLAPTLEITQQPRKTTDPTVTFDVAMADNFEYLRLLINGSEVFKVDETTNESGKVGIAREASFNFDLVPGENTFVFELQDVNGNVTTKTIVVFYGEIENPVEEIYGRDRYATAVETSKKAFDSSRVALLASGENFPDALSGGPLAYAMNAPILLSTKDAIPAVTLNELQRLGVREVTILGGEAALSKAVEDQLAQAGITFTRLAGSTRYDTSYLIGQELARLSNFNQAFLVSGENYPDALAAGVPAARLGAPILLTGKSQVPNTILRGLVEWEVSEVYAIGGKLVIEDSVLNALSNNYQAERISGPNRYATSVMIAEKFMKDAAGAAFTSGVNYPDALSGGVYAAQKNYPLLLVNLEEVPAEVANYVTQNNIYQGIIYGGEKAIPAPVRTQIYQLLQ